MFLIFGGKDFYPAGGASDLIETHDDESCAIQRALELVGMVAVTRKAFEDTNWDEDDTRDIEWTQVYCVESGEIIHATHEHQLKMIIEAKEEV